MQNAQVRPVQDLRNRHAVYVNSKLEEAEAEAKKNGAKWTDSKKVMKKLRTQYCSEKKSSRT